MRNKSEGYANKAKLLEILATDGKLVILASRVLETTKTRKAEFFTLDGRIEKVLKNNVYNLAVKGVDAGKYNMFSELIKKESWLESWRITITAKALTPEIK